MPNRVVYNFYPLHVVSSDPLYWAEGRLSTFGGPNDPGDSGNTASGFSTKDHPAEPYVALPQALCQWYGLPFFCRVTVENMQTGRQVKGYLVDYGPAGWTGRRLDVSPVIAAELGLQTDDVAKFYIRPAEQVSHP